MSSVLKHNLIAFAGSFILAAILLWLTSATKGNADFIGSSLALAVPFFIAYVYFRSYLVDAEPEVRYRSTERVGQVISAVGVLALSAVLTVHSKSQSASENPGLTGFGFPELIAMAIAGLAAWGGYRIARWAIWNQALITQTLTDGSERSDE
ncbi:hypothetical protein [Roseiconus lacunae]|uniref:hypothetical protein n=1 Tax=Roseiconus lacunae TaxID=2605694 RepID=UPI001E3936F5|nr:hypothetical protein [Roseiconus lacunae]MCD0462161.1 hypothetical protein [Roseiconus lacunae]